MVQPPLSLFLAQFLHDKGSLLPATVSEPPHDPGFPFRLRLWLVRVVAQCWVVLGRFLRCFIMMESIA